jgi:hypothetical protein
MPPAAAAFNPSLACQYFMLFYPLSTTTVKNVTCCALQMNCGHGTRHFDSKKICWVFIDRGVAGFVCGSWMICHHSTAYS